MTQTQTRQKIIIDTDPGQDDAVAILLALASPELELLGITCVAGNVPPKMMTPSRPSASPAVSREIGVRCSRESVRFMTGRL